jgi:acetyltransferase-like isoleucine patch superfamily enzyme
MDKRQIEILRKSFKEYLKTDGPYFEFSVGPDIEKRKSILFQVLFPGIHRLFYYTRHFISRIAQFIDYSPVKIFLYRLVGFKIGKGVYISPDVILDSQFPELVEIGDYVVLGWGAKIFVHDYNGVIYRVGRVKIGRGTVIGGFSFIRSGVSIDEMSLVKLGSLVFNNDNSNIESQLKSKEYNENKDI